MIAQEYLLVETDEQMREIAQELKQFARFHPFDFKKATALVQQDDSLKKEMVGPMLRVKGNQQSAYVDQYNRYISIPDCYTCQLSYYEMAVEGIGLVGQVTIVDNLHKPLTQEAIDFVLKYLFNGKKYQKMETPEYVFVGFCNQPNEKTN